MGKQKIVELFFQIYKFANWFHCIDLLHMCLMALSFLPWKRACDWHGAEEGAQDVADAEGEHVGAGIYRPATSCKNENASYNVYI